MKQKIESYLKTIEEKYNVEILLACETGSRAWGFPSPDSDYDVRIIYKHKKDWYLSLQEKKDTIELMFDENEIDISGWDLRKSLRLLWKSNPPFLERIQSHIIYKVDEAFLSEINILAQRTYSRIATIHHYLSMSLNCLSEIDRNAPYKLKKLFYALRAAVACKWIIEQQEMPPISFLKMLEGLEFEKGIKERIYELIALKATLNESYFHSGDLELIALIENLLETARAESKKLPAGSADFKDLDDFFLRLIA
jgi:predicted nucleotidyltransferase